MPVTKHPFTKTHLLKVLPIYSNTISIWEIFKIQSVAIYIYSYNIVILMDAAYNYVQTLS